MLADLLDLVLPRACAGCAAPGRTLCPSCAGALCAPRRHRPDPCPAGLPALVAAAPYDGVARAALLAHKERGRLALAGPLGVALAAAVVALDPPRGVVLVPVPSSPAAVRERGHDHARRLATAAARRVPGARARALLVPTRLVGDQAGLRSAARAANLAGALRARGPLDAVPVVLVDDVVTTGATLTEASRALEAAGARLCGAAVVAATQRRAGAGAGGRSAGTAALDGAAGPPERTAPLSRRPVGG